jgi:MFS family permease
MLFTVNTLMIVFMEVPLNAATTRWPHHRALALGALLFAVGSGALAFAHGPALVVVAIIVWTFGEMMLFPQASAYVAEIAPVHRRGQYMGAYSLSFSLAFAVAPWAGATGLHVHGPLLLWLAVFAVGLVSSLLMLRVSE